MGAVWLQIVVGVLSAAALITAIGVIGRGLLYLIKLLRRLDQTLNDFRGEEPRPGLPEGRPGLFDRLASIEGKQATSVETLAAMEVRLAAVEAQLQPNGGSSLRDAVNRIADTLPSESFGT